jgi:hypothetical protein
MPDSPLWYRLLRKLPFKEAWLPFKMLRGSMRNKHFVFPEFVEAQIPGGSLKLHNGVPVMRLSGTPAEIGLAHGKLIGPQVRALTERYLSVFAGRREHDLMLARRMEQHIPDAMRAELRALGEGAEIGYDQALLTACFLDLHKVAACSTIVVHGPSSRSGEPVFGRNLDFPSLNIAHRANLLVVITPERGQPFASIAWPGFTGVLSGMNQSGLAISMMLVYGHTRYDHTNGIPFALHYRQLLEDHASVPEALARLGKREFGVCNNLMLADASRGAAVAEMRSDGVGVIPGDETYPFLRCTNHFRTGPRKWALAFTAPSSYPRLWRLNSAAKRSQTTRQPIDESEVKELLARVAIRGINLQRMVFYPERRELEVAFGNPKSRDREYHYFNRHELWRGAAAA